jgi:hypothetical protein
VRIFLLPLDEYSLSTFYVGKMGQFRAPWQRHSFRKIAVALRNIRPSFAALLVFFHLFVARRMWKRTAPHPFLSILRCVRYSWQQGQRRDAG